MQGPSFGDSTTMNFKDLLLPVGLLLLTTFAIQYFFLGGDKTKVSGGQSVRSGQSFTAPQSKQEQQPLIREIDFIDERRLHKKELTEVDTDLATFSFSNDGASLERIEIKRKINGKQSLIGTVFPPMEREDKCFLVALNEKTPYYYKFMGTSETDSSIEVRYRYTSPASDVSINKTYTIFKETYKLNLTLEVVSKKGLQEGVKMRLFYPSPFTPNIPKGISAVFVNEKGSVKKAASGSLKKHQGWFRPAMFGSDNKYFIHAMIQDRDAFVQRAYYRGPSQKKIFSILEGPLVTENTSWTLSFYFGPKEEGAMARVDSRLEQTLDYSGLLAPVSKIMLSILKFFYKYIGNYGLAIILLTFLIRLSMFPFTMGAEKSAQKSAEMKKKMKYIEQKYKHNKEALSAAKAELIRKHGLPGLGSCLPMLLQLPIFWALNRVLSSSIEFYQAPFFGWITDLSAKDPYYVLPVCMVLVMLFQASIADKNMRVMLIGFALFFGALTANFAAGLALYIVVSVLLGVLQTVIQKKMKASRDGNVTVIR